MLGERRHNLPAHQVALIGREDAVATVRERLRGAEGGLLTLTGAGGCGKTSLAMQVASELLDAFPDGVWLVELAGLRQPELVLQAVASTLGVREGPGRPLLEALTAFLEPRRLLLVLDNCEHLVGACAELAEALLRACPHLRILATSREPLGTRGESTWRVPSLALPDPRRPQPLAELAAYPAVRLFVTRARAAQSTFALTPENVSAVVGLCERLAGIPLALELAAARVRVLSVEQVVERLGDSFRLLSGGSRTAPSRQQTLEAAMDWSYDLLSGPERAAFRRLAVFAGGFDLEAAEAVCSDDGVAQADVLDLLTRLLDKSLVAAEEQAGVVGYRLLEPIRQYAQGRLATHGEAVATRHRHAAHYLALAERHELDLRDWRHAAWSSRLELDHDNVRAALRWALESGEVTTALRLAVAVWLFWRKRGYVSEGQRWLEAGLEQGGELPASLRLRALNRAGNLSWARSDYARAAALAGESLTLARELGDDWNATVALNCLGDVATAEGDFAAARALNEEGLALARQLGDTWMTGQLLNNLGVTAMHQGDEPAADTFFRESLALFRDVSDSWSTSRVLVQLGTVARNRGEYARAARLATEGVDLLWREGAAREATEGLEVLATVAGAQGRPEQAARLLAASEAWREIAAAPRPALNRPALERTLMAARAALGEAAFAAAWEVGRAWSLDQAIGAVLAEDTSPSPDTSRERATAQPLGPLSAREREVAALVARGLTNQQVAAALVIAEGTAANHVHNILNKLGCDSRAQVAAWAAQHGLLADGAD